MDDNPFPYLVGFELEGFFRGGISGPELSTFNKSVGNLGCVTTELGCRQLEVVTNPFRVENDKSVIHHLEQLVACIPDEWELEFCAKDPGYVSGVPKDWVRSPRYTAMLEALAREKPDHWQVVLEISKWCAIHINVGISPWSPEGILLMNVLNNVGPYIGASTREDCPDSSRHMAIWSEWADVNRLPYHENDVCCSKDAYAKEFADTSSLIKEGDGGEGSYEVDLVTPRSLDNIIDLGTNWKLCRPKLSSTGQWYLEIRVLPSMPLKTLKFYVEEIFKGIQAIVIWDKDNISEYDFSIQDVSAAIQKASEVSEVFPKIYLSKQQWEYHFQL